MKSRVLLIAALICGAFPAGQAWAANPTIKDGSTLQLGNVTYRLDGVDTPALDQVCIDEHADALRDVIPRGLCTHAAKPAKKP